MYKYKSVNARILLHTMCDDTWRHKISVTNKIKQKKMRREKDGARKKINSTI